MESQELIVVSYHQKIKYEDETVSPETIIETSSQ